MRRSLDRRPGGYGSNSGAVADFGKYQLISSDDEEGGIDMISAAELSLDENLATVRQALGETGRILVVGGASGFYGPAFQRNGRLLQFVSTERRAGDDSFTIANRHVRVVFLTKFVAHKLSHAVQESCKAAGIPCVGIFGSPGSVMRAVAHVFEIPQRSDEKVTIATKLGDIMPGLTYSERDERTMPQQPLTISLAPKKIADRETGSDTVEMSILKMFSDAHAAIELAQEAALKALREARRNDTAAKKLAALKAAFADEDE